MANLEHVEDGPKHVKMSSENPDTCTQKPAIEASSAGREVLAEVPCIIPSFAAASELVSAPYSCLVMNTHRRHVVLPPMYLNKKRTAIREELQAEQLKFSPSLQGVPLAYDNIQIVRRHGDIYDDSGYIHMDIQANFIIFRPKQGDILLGKVNKLGVSHVGCLVHGCFNASIPKPNSVSVDTWREAGPRIGTELEFEVTALDADTAGVLLIRGRLSRTRVQELLAFAEGCNAVIAVDQANAEGCNSSITVNQEEPEPFAETCEEPVVEDSTKKKKKKKKDKIKEEVDSNGGTTLELNGAENDENGGKKKKKKEMRLKKEEESVQLSLVEVHVSDSSGYLSDKPKKKRKREKENKLIASFSQDAEEPKPKKKKRKGDLA